MQTDIKKTGNTVIVKLNRKISFETCIPLENSLNQLKTLLQDPQSHHQVIFNFKELEFVGSSGMGYFFQLLKNFQMTLPTKPLYCHVKNEFQKMIKAFDDEDAWFECYETEQQATQSKIKGHC